MTRPREHTEYPPRPSSRLWPEGGPRFDLLAGLTVALVGLPQCLAYAMMSGLPPAYGLTTAAVPGLVAALVGKSPQVVTGPTNTTGLLILAALGPWLGANGLLGPEGLPVLATLTLLAGAIRVAGSYLGAAHLLRFLPESVLVGFTAGAGILIGVMQLDEALGLPPIQGAGLFGEIGGVVETIRGGTLPAPGAVAVTGGTAVAILLGRRFVPRWPIALLAVALATGAAWLLKLDAASGLPIVEDRSPIPGGWPEGALPDLRWSVVRELLLPAAAITLLGTLELTVSARAGGERPDMAREIRAQGWANVAGAFTSAFPASASLTRSALLKLGGARSRLAAVVAAAAVIPILLFAGGAVGWIPQASLAGVLLVTAYGMVRRGPLLRMWRASAETRVLMAATAIATLLLPLEYAILVGAGLGLLIHLAKTSEPRVTILRPQQGGRLVPVIDGEPAPRTVILEVSGNLHYAAVPPFVARTRTLVPEEAELVVIDLSHAQDLRFAALQAFEQLAAELEARGTTLKLAGVDPAFCAALERAESPLSVTPFEAEPGRSVALCLGREGAAPGGGEGPGEGAGGEAREGEPSREESGPVRRSAGS